MASQIFFNTAWVLAIATGCGQDKGAGRAPESLVPQGSPEPVAVRGQWPSFGHDSRGTRASEDTLLSRANVSDLEKIWGVDLPGCTSTPAVVDGTVYVGDWSGHVRAFNATTGKEKWATRVGPSAVDDSPLVGKELVFVGDGGGNLHALRRDTGAPEWTLELDDNPGAHIYSSPTLVEQMVLIGVASLEVVTGPSGFYGSVLAVDAQNGVPLWRTYVTGEALGGGRGVSVWSSFSVDADLGYAYIGTGQAHEQPASNISDALIAVNYRENGDLVWSRQFTENDVFTLRDTSGPDFDIGATPTVYEVDGKPMVAVGDKGGVFSAFDRSSGDNAWTHAIELSQGSPQGGVMVSSAFADGTLYVSSNEFRADGGALDDPLMEDVHIDYALFAGTGEVIWRDERPFPSVGGMAWANGLVFNTSTDGTLYARNSDTGEVLWSVMPAGEDRETPGRFIASGASIAEGKVFTCHGFTFFKTAGSGPIDGGLVAYGLK